MNRRGFLGAILAAGVAPAAIGSGILMPVRLVESCGWASGIHFDGGPAVVDTIVMMHPGTGYIGEPVLTLGGIEIRLDPLLPEGYAYFTDAARPFEGAIPPRGEQLLREARAFDVMRDAGLRVPSYADLRGLVSPDDGRSRLQYWGHTKVHA